ncbi:hypothetical protein [Fulvivirga sp. M361]|uniref:hypothetical protein n=1 Tax=Fulvivirga sp. M361 TaxID=2594266 RepID=UPI0016251484|nr:hypothetical protein [Fulvivirga sp. M361]
MNVDKKKKAIMVAIAYYLEKENATKSNMTINQAWSEHARIRTIQDHENVQRRGRLLLK